jgi:hypothetical protein
MLKLPGHTRYAYTPSSSGRTTAGPESAAVAATGKTTRSLRIRAGDWPTGDAGAVQWIKTKPEINTSDKTE